MKPEVNLLVDGQLCPAASGASYSNIAPATEAVIGEAADADSEDMDRAITAARRAFDQTDWSVNHEFRLRCLQQLRDALLAAQDELRAIISAETGAPMGICGGGGRSVMCLSGFSTIRSATFPSFSGVAISALLNPWARRVDGWWKRRPLVSLAP